MKLNSISPVSIPASIIRDYEFVSAIPSGEAFRLFEELAKFLYVAAQTITPLAPSPAIDAAWHDFILHTRAYQEYCTNNYHRLIHHSPERGLGVQNRGRYVATIAALRHHFGEVDHHFWPHSESYLSEVCDSNCSGDSCDTGEK